MSEPFSSEAFRQALAHFASGVTIVTTRTAGGPVGFTASAFTSVSLSPPLVLVCVGKRGSAHDATVAAELFGVSVLLDRQGWIADQFGRSGIDRFRDVPLRAATSSGATSRFSGSRCTGGRSCGSTTRPRRRSRRR